MAVAFVLVEVCRVVTIPNKEKGKAKLLAFWQKGKAWTITTVLYHWQVFTVHLRIPPITSSVDCHIQHVVIPCVYKRCLDEAPPASCHCSFSAWECTEGGLYEESLQEAAGAAAGTATWVTMLAMRAENLDISGH